MKPSLWLSIVTAFVFLQGALAIPRVSAKSAVLDQQSSAAQPKSDASADAAPSITISGPLRSFLRMAGLSQAVAPNEVLPTLSHTVVLQGYQLGRPTEFLVLLRRYVRQSNELSALAQNQALHVKGCDDAESLLRILGYRIEGSCGNSEMRLITADPERAFLTIDSGFPLVDLEDALQHNKPFSLDYRGTAVPVVFTSADWVSLTSTKEQEGRGLLETLLYEPQVARLYWAFSRIDPSTAVLLKKEVPLAKLLPLASVVDLYGSQICVRSGVVVVPGGHAAEKQWQEIVGASVKSPSDFVYQLLTKDHGWMAAYFDAMARANESQQAHFSQGQRYKRYYAAYRAPGTSPDAGARLPFRPAPALLVLVTRMQWDEQGNPYVPGSIETWNAMLAKRTELKFVHAWNKHTGSWKSAEDLADGMFTYSRLETDAGPLQAYLYLTELDHRRGISRRVSNSTAILLADRFPDYSDQYLLFSEFPDLTDTAIAHFISTADAVSKISDHTTRGNAMGILQANVGIWQILARQRQIDAGQLNESFLETIKPFSDISTSPQLFSAGRASIERVFQAAGRPKASQAEMIDALAGNRDGTPDGQQVHTELGNRIQAVLNDQRLVSLDTLFKLDDGLRDFPQDANRRDELAAVSGELREFEMPQPIFTSSERTRWAAGTYNNHHTELQMRTDIAKVIRSSPSPKQLENARGQLSTFLRDTLVGMNYAYYEPPASQVLHNNPLFVRSHDFSGDTVMGVEKLWRAPRLFGAGSPAGGGAHLIGSLSDLPYVLAEAEQDFIAPEHVQSLIWQQFVPGLLSNAVVPRWWNVSKEELHTVALYQQAGDELIVNSAKDSALKAQVMEILSDRLFPDRQAWVEEELRGGQAAKVLEALSPADTFYLAAEYRERHPGELQKTGVAGTDLETLLRNAPDSSSWQRLSRDFGVIHPIFAQTYGQELINVRPFPALGGAYNRLMSECWDSGNLYWARLTDEMGYSPVQLNRIVPILTRRMVEKIAASDLEDLPATIRAMRETGDEFRQGKLAAATGVAQAKN